MAIDPTELEPAGRTNGRTALNSSVGAMLRAAAHRKAIPKHLPLLAASLLFLCSAGAQAALFRVGNDAACTHATLAGAIQASADNGAGVDFIRVAKNHLDTAIAVDIVDHSVRIDGGYDTCADTTPSGATTLDGAGGTADSVLEIVGDEIELTVVLTRLRITGGEDDGEGGGGIRVEGTADIELIDTTVISNHAISGGGIRINGFVGSSVPFGASLTLTNSQILDNDAERGAGIDCRYADLVQVGGAVALNHATSAGGGYYMVSCNFELRDAIGPFAGAYLNTADVQGGGMFTSATTDERVDPKIKDFAFSNNQSPKGGALHLDLGTVIIDRAQFKNNVATEGGAIFHELSVVEVHNSTFEGNEATDGGAIFTEGRTMKIWRSTFAGNEASDEGGAIYIARTGMSIFHSTFSQNTAFFGGAIFSDGAASPVSIYSSTFVHQVANDGVDIFNLAGSTTLRNSLLAGGCFVETSSQWNVGGGNVGIGTTCELDAMDDSILPSLGSLDLGPLAWNGGPTRTHLPGRESPLRDSGYPICFGDDQRGVPRTDGACDVGAVELGDLFSDGFEGGDTANWN